MNKLEVYFSKLPKSCFECPCFKNDLEFPCGLSDGTQDFFKDEIDGDKCPLKKIQSRDLLCKKLDSLSKENSHLKAELDRLNKALEMTKHIERYDIGEMFKENAKLIIEKRQFAINELEKMKFKLKEKRCLINTAEHDYLQKFVRWYDICDLINKQINELKGEKCNEYK